VRIGSNDDWSERFAGNQGKGALSPELITRDLDTSIVGRNLVCRDRVGSTNDIAAGLAREGAQEGTVVVAEEQTCGRGRLGRRWRAPAGSSLLMSVVFYPSLLASQIQRVAMVCSLGVQRGIKIATGLAAQLKWPNDIVIGGRKVAGLLAEAGVSGDHVNHVVVGVGLNVNLDPEGLEDVLLPATSLSQELGRSVDRIAVLRSVLREMDRLYVRLTEGWSPKDAWASNLATLGCRVTLTQGTAVLTGVAEDVDENGVLLLRDPQGRVHRLPIGDVTSHHP